MVIRKLDTLIKLAQKRPPKRLVVAFGQDEPSLSAVQEATDLGIIKATIVGDQEVIEDECKKLGFDCSKIEIKHERDEMSAGRKAVCLINEGEGDILMKGLISSDKYLRCILDKDHGLMLPKATLSHVTLVQVPTYPKLLIISDAAFIPQPTIQQKIKITEYVIDTALNLGIEKPKVAIISFTEKANPKIESCNDAAIIAKMGDRGQIKHALIDGPLALDVAVDAESAKIKKINSPVAGDADCLVFPNLETGNVFYKSMTKLAKGNVAAYVTGTKVPCILPSRGDSKESKLYSIALATLMA